MEQARFWMWASSKNGSEYDFMQPASSWEEQAFAEDASGPFGAFIWPPRSYSCSFCGREFKSAQALGGHMNVHRRDRARLKQHSPISESKNIHHKKPSDSRTFEYPNHASTMDNNSSDVVNNNSRELHHQNPSYSSNPSSSDPDSIRSLSILNSNIEEEYYTKKRNCDTAKPDELPVSLNFAVASGNNEMASCKRRRTDGLSLPLCLINTTTAELDLELRLGNQPKA